MFTYMKNQKHRCWNTQQAAWTFHLLWGHMWKQEVNTYVGDMLPAGCANEVKLSSNGHC